MPVAANIDQIVAQTHRRLRRGMSFRVIFLLQDLEVVTRGLKDFEAKRDACLVCTAEYVSADTWCSYYRDQATRIRRRLATARAEEGASKLLARDES